METEQVLQGILQEMQKMNDNHADAIAMGSLIVAVVALIVSLIVSYKTHKQYIDSLAPALSFKLFERNNFIVLSITNTGQTKAEHIVMNFDSLRNNGEETLLPGNVFEQGFVLYPGETITGDIALSGRNMVTQISPILKVKIAYIKGNDGKNEIYSRMVHFTQYEKETTEPSCNVDLKGITDGVRSIMYSENRIANYIEGRTLFTYDEINCRPHSSLFQDMKEAFNNVERTEKNSEDEQ